MRLETCLFTTQVTTKLHVIHVLYFIQFTWTREQNVPGKCTAHWNNRLNKKTDRLLCRLFTYNLTKKVSKWPLTSSYKEIKPSPRVEHSLDLEMDLFLGTFFTLLRNPSFCLFHSFHQLPSSLMRLPVGTKTSIKSSQSSSRKKPDNGWLPKETHPLYTICFALSCLSNLLLPFLPSLCHNIPEQTHSFQALELSPWFTVEIEVNVSSLLWQLSFYFLFYAVVTYIHNAPLSLSIFSPSYLSTFFLLSLLSPFSLSVSSNNEAISSSK